MRFAKLTSSQCTLSLLRHHVGLVEDDELVRRATNHRHNSLSSVHPAREGIAHPLPAESPYTREVLDLFPDDFDTSFIRRIELQYIVSVRVPSLSSNFFAIDLSCYTEDRTCLSCSWRTVEKHVWERVGSEEFVD